MTTLADVAAAIRASDSTGWVLADAVAGLPDFDDQGKLTLDRVSLYIWETVGVELTPAHLSRYRVTARAFPLRVRAKEISFAAHMELRTCPQKLARWKPTKKQPVLTQEGARALRGRSSAAKPKEGVWRADLKKAFKIIDAVTEYDPDLVLDLLEQTAAGIRRKYAKQLKAGGRGLRAV